MNDKKSGTAVLERSESQEPSQTDGQASQSKSASNAKIHADASRMGLIDASAQRMSKRLDAIAASAAAHQELQGEIGEMKRELAESFERYAHTTTRDKDLIRRIEGSINGAESYLLKKLAKEELAEEKEKEQKKEGGKREAEKKAEEEKKKEKEEHHGVHGYHEEHNTDDSQTVEEAVAATGATGATAATMVAVEKGVQKGDPTAKPAVITKQNNPWGAYKQHHDQAVANAKTTSSTTKQTVSRGGTSAPKAIANQKSEAVTTKTSVLAKGEIIPHSFSRFQPPMNPSDNFLSSPRRRINLLPRSAPIALGATSDEAYDEGYEEPFNDRGSAVSGNPNQDDDNDDRHHRPRRRGKNRPQRQPQRGSGSGSSDGGGGGGGRGKIGSKVANAGRGAGRAAAQGGKVAAQGGRAALQVAARAAPLLANPYVLAVIAAIIIILIIIFAIVGIQAPEDGQENPLVTNMTCNPPQTTVGQTVVCTITASYPGNAEDVTITATLLEGSEYISSDPAGVTAAGAEGMTVTWSANQLNLPINPVAISVTITVRTTVDNKTVPILYNVSVIGGSLAGGGGSFPPTQDNCGGKYQLNNPIGNFGDPPCDFNKQDMGTLLQELDPANAQRWDSIIACESTYNPNAFNGDSTSGFGAYGLLQMNPHGKASPTDVGDVYWKQQIENGVAHRKRIDSFEAYWQCA